MATADQFIRECEKHLGETELYTGEHPDWAWCAKFLSSCAKDIGGLGFDSWTASGVYASCTPIPDDEVEAGDLVCFNFGGEERTDWFDHIGLVTYFDHASDIYHTIEGNSGTNFNVGRYVYHNETYPPKTYFCRPHYTKEETVDDFDETWFNHTLNDAITDAGETSPANMLWGCYCLLTRIEYKLDEILKEEKEG